MFGSKQGLSGGTRNKPEYADKIRLMCKTMHDNGYMFVLTQSSVD